MEKACFITVKYSSQFSEEYFPLLWPLFIYSFYFTAICLLQHLLTTKSYQNYNTGIFYEAAFSFIFLLQ